MLLSSVKYSVLFICSVLFLFVCAESARCCNNKIFYVPFCHWAFYPNESCVLIMGQGKVPKIQTYETRWITLFFSIAHYMSARTISSVYVRYLVNADKTKYMVMSRDHIAGRSQNMKTDSSSFERVEHFRYLGTPLTN